MHRKWGNTKGLRDKFRATSKWTDKLKRYHQVELKDRSCEAEVGLHQRVRCNPNLGSWTLSMTNSQCISPRLCFQWKWTTTLISIVWITSVLKTWTAAKTCLTDSTTWMSTSKKSTCFRLKIETDLCHLTTTTCLSLDQLVLRSTQTKEQIKEENLPLSKRRE